MSMHWNSYGKYLLTGVVLGSFLLYAPSVTEAKRAHKAPQNSAEVTVAVPDVMNETKQAQRPSRKHQADPKIGIRQDLRGEEYRAGKQAEIGERNGKSVADAEEIHSGNRDGNRQPETHGAFFLRKNAGDWNQNDI